jgi:hypothetical protein
MCIKTAGIIAPAGKALVTVRGAHTSRDNLKIPVSNSRV